MFTRLAYFRWASDGHRTFSALAILYPALVWTGLVLMGWMLWLGGSQLDSKTQEGETPWSRVLLRERTPHAVGLN